MKTKRPLPILLFLLCCLMFFSDVHAQTETHNFVTYDTSINAPYAGIVWRLRISRPANMFTINNPDTASRPAIITIPGQGEMNSFGGLQAYGPHYWLNNGWDGSVILGNGTHYPILITINSSNTFMTAQEANDVIDIVLSKFHIKKNSVHVAGLSQGGFALSGMLLFEATAGAETGMKKIKSLVCLEGASEELQYPYSSWSQGPAGWGHWAKKYGGKFFGLEGITDYRVVSRVSIPMNDSVPGSAYFAYENIGGGAHCCWNSMYNPSATNWRDISPMGPNIVTGADPNTMGTYFTPSNVFQWMLRQGDTSLVGTAVTTPTVDAGTNQTINLPITLATLSGSATPASGSSITGYSWSEVSGGIALILTPLSASTTVTGLALGSYTFRLTATASNGTSSYADVNVVVNTAPTANAGTDRTITLPTNSVTLNGSGSDPDGTIASYQWAKISGPSTFTIASATAAQTAVNSLIQGTYVFQLTVTDNMGATGKDTVQVTVNAAPNVAPTAAAGTDQTITLPTNTVTVNGTGADADGTIASYQWSKISGPATFTIVSPTTAQTAVNNLVQGTYQFQLTVTDNGGATGKDTLQVVVNAAINVAPTAAAGLDQIITLPTNTVTLNGSGADADGTIASYQWTKISGPATFTVVSPTAAQTAVNNLVQGIYQFQLTVTDNNGATGKDTVQVTVNAAPNVAPTAAAGTDQTITLPTNSVTLNGTGTDADGTIASYQWTKISGPTTFTIVSPTTALTAVNNLLQGTYQFQLTVTDNGGATGKDTVQVTVNAAPNVAPTAIAGSDQTITLPTNTVTLNGSGADADGTIASYQWTKITGPASFSIVSPTLAATVINNLVQGSYQFQLTVVDNGGATGKDTIQVTVNAAPNVAPTATAGADQTITLPTNTVTLNGIGTDADGTIASYQWTKISGPATFTIASPALATTAVNNLVQGTYQFQLTVVDNTGAAGKDTLQVTVNAPLNLAPTAVAGADQTITLPTTSVTLNGNGTDIDGTIASYQWTKISGPASFTILSPTLAQTVVNNLAQGVYKFELTVTDNNGAAGKDTVQVTVDVAGNIYPTANAGADQTITLPTNTVTLNGSGTDADGTIASYQWTKISGPASFTIVSPTQAQTVVDNLTQGLYQFELAVDDNSGAVTKDTLQITVNAAANVLPSANAGSDQIITLPTTTIMLNGSGIDIDGTIASYQWTKISGPASFTIVSPTVAQTAVDNLVQGIYQFELTVTDNSGAIAKDTVQVTVNAAANVSPTVNAGTDQTITLPVNTVTLNGNANDADGTIASYQWTGISGPAGFTLVSPASAQTAVTGLVQGVYQFELTVADNNGATAKDTVQVTVNAAGNVSPTVNAGTDQTITLPVNMVTLNGNANDADGTIASYQWTGISGPAGFTLVSPASAQTAVTSLVQGIYQFELTVTDNNGATAKDTVQVTVNAALNVSPTVNAGTDQTITLPVNTVTLNGSGVDVDGSIASYQWTNISGPATFTIASPTAPQTAVNNLVQGVYQFELTVTDNNGATAKDTLQVTVNAAANIPPTANAGPNQTITLPLSTVTLSGSGIDADGNIVSYQWTKLSGGAAVIVSPLTGVTLISGLQQGPYVFRLTVTDNSGATATADVTITVNAAITNPNAPIVTKVAITEYKVGYLASNGNFYSFVTQQMQPYNLGGRKVLDVAAGFNELIMLDDQGFVWKNIVNSTTAVRWNTDTTGAPFDKNIAVYGYYPNYTSIRTDSSLWYWGNDDYHFFYTSNRIDKPIQLSPVGMKIKKVVMGYYKITVLTTNGQVWVFNRGNSTPVQMTIPRPAIDIFGSHWDFQGCIIPDVNGDQTMGYPYVWGAAYGLWGGNAPLTQPTSLKSLWNVTAPIKEIASSYNTTHYIDSLGRMYGIGNNAQGEIGNGVELVNRRELYHPEGTPYSWTWTNDEFLTGAPAVQIGSGITWKHLWKGNTLSFYSYASDANDSLYSWGRNKALALGNGYLNWQEATYPNAMDVLSPKPVSPLGAIYQTYNFVPYTINAGPDQNTTGSTVSLSGVAVASSLSASGAVYNGKATIGYNISSYLWTKLSGPGGTITSPNTAATTVTGLTPGSYKFKLLMTDNNTATIADTVTINVTVPGVNVSPTANAGTDQTIMLPVNTVTLTGSGADPDGTISSYQWTKISGPSTFTIASPSQAQTTVNNLVQGVYQFVLTVTDNLGATGKDTVNVTVKPQNIPPVANAGVNQIITLPANSVTLTGSGSDADGSVVLYQWTKIYGPAQYQIVTASQPQTVVNNLAQGVYQFELTVIDNLGATGKDTVTIAVNGSGAPSNVSPIANAGADQTQALPASSITLSGSGIDVDGTIASYQWTKIAGPTQFSIVSPSQAQTAVNNLSQGVYQFVLTVTDNLGATGKDTVTVTITAAPPPNQPPIANAGLDVNITLPNNSVTLSGTGTDPDGTIASYQWIKISGPTQYAIVSQSQPQTSINNLVQGTYQFQLTVTDNNGASASDLVNVVVNPAPAAPNRPPLANAGPDQDITLRINSAALSGSGTDADGTIVSYQWTKISGPTQYSIDYPNQAQTDVKNLEVGTYQFELRVTDNLGAVGRDTVEITVSDELKSTAKLYPNPATTTITLQIDAATKTNNMSIKIYDALGMLVYREDLVRSQQTMIKQIDVSRFEDGTYFVEFDVDINNTMVLKFIKQ